MDYKQTLNLPQTEFPMRANLPAREPDILARWKREGLYRRLLDGSGRGDHVVTVEVEVPNPRDLSPEEVQLLRRLAELGGHAVKEEKTVLDRVKNLFG